MPSTVPGTFCSCPMQRRLGISRNPWDNTVPHTRTAHLSLPDFKPRFGIHRREMTRGPAFLQPNLTYRSHSIRLRIWSYFFFYNILIFIYQYFIMGCPSFLSQDIAHYTDYLIFNSDVLSGCLVSKYETLEYISFTTNYNMHDWRHVPAKIVETWSLLSWFCTTRFINLYSLI